MNEVEVHPLDAPASALVLEAGEVLVELSFGQQATFSLPAELLGLVVADAALPHPGFTATPSKSELFQWVLQ